MKIAALICPLLCLASLPSNAQEPPNYDAIYSNCIKEHGTMNNGVVEACAGTVSKEAQNEIAHRYASIYAEHNSIDPNVARLFEDSQKAWILYRDTYCSFVFSYTGSPADMYCGMILDSERAVELRRID